MYNIYFTERSKPNRPDEIKVKDFSVFVDDTMNFIKGSVRIIGPKKVKQMVLNKFEFLKSEAKKLRGKIPFSEIRYVFHSAVSSACGYCAYYKNILSLNGCRCGVCPGKRREDAGCTGLKYITDLYDAKSYKEFLTAVNRTIKFVKSLPEKVRENTPD